MKNISKSEKYFKEISNFVKEFDFKSFKDSTFLITGATGLIGSYLIDSLLLSNQNITVVALVRDINKAKDMFSSFNKNNFLQLVQLNDLDFDETKIPKNVDYIVSSASFSDSKNFAMYPVETIKVNVLLNIKLLEMSKKLKLKKYIFLSSSEVYGKCQDVLFEDTLGLVDTMDIRSCYNESKRLTETLCVSYSNEYSIPCVIARPSRIYGPTMKIEDSKALSQFMYNAINGKDIVLKSTGEQLFSFCYVKDTVSGILTLLLKGKCCEAYNLTSDESLKLKDIAQKVASFCNRKVVFEVPSELEKKGYSRSLVAVQDTTKIKSLGWKPTTSFDFGIQNTISILKELIS